MNDKEKEQHRKAFTIVVNCTAKEFTCTTKEVFRLTHSLNNTHTAQKEYADWCRCRKVSESVYDFCLDVLSGKIVPVTINKKKAKKRNG